MRIRHSAVGINFTADIDFVRVHKYGHNVRKRTEYSGAPMFIVRYRGPGLGGAAPLRDVKGRGSVPTAIEESANVNITARRSESRHPWDSCGLGSRRRGWTDRICQFVHMQAASDRQPGLG